MSARHTSRFARALERELERIHGRPWVLSPRDFALVVEWHARGVPLGLVVESLREAAGQRPHRPPRSLASLARRVDEDWRAMREGRLPKGREVARDSREAAGAVERWRRAARREGESSLGQFLRALIGQLDEGGDPAAVEKRLERELLAHVDRTRRARMRRELQVSLAPYRRRMGAPMYRRTLRRALVTALRRELDLPSLH